MELNNIQLNILNQIYSHQSTYIISGRQLGMSIAVMAFAMREATDCNKIIGVMTNINCFYHWFNFMKNHAPNDFDYARSKNNEIRFKNGGRIILRSPTRNAFSGYRLNIFINDNVTIYNYLIHSIISSMRSDYKLVITSTGATGDAEFEGYGFHRYRVNEESKYYKRKIKHFIKKLT